MAKRTPLPPGPGKKPPTKRPGRRRRGLSKTGLAKYLRADCHLYGPLVAGGTSSLSTSKALHFPDTGSVGVKGRRPVKGKEKTLLEKFVEYLKSDSYMYASLVDVGNSPPAPGPVHQVEKVTMATSRTVMSVKAVIRRESPEGSRPESAVSEHLGLGHRETVKHTVYHNCRTSSSSGTESMSRELRRLIG